MSTPEELKEKLEAQSSSNLILDLVNRLGGSAKATIVYGDPIDREGITIIPVAKVRWGFGFGGGKPKGEERSGGGGGGVTGVPVGYIEIKDGQSRFRRTQASSAVGVMGTIGATIVLCLGIVGWAWGRKEK